MQQFKEQTVSGSILDLKNDVVNYLGPDLILEDCKINIQTSARGLIINQVQFLNCHIQVRKKLTNFQDWCCAVLKGCKFTGVFSSNDFGFFEEYDSHGAISDCDFSDAILDGCRFFSTDIDSIVLPPWPSFTILNPSIHKSELDAIKWPDNSRYFVETLVSSPKQTTAVVDSAKLIAKELGLSEAALKALLSDQSFIKI